MNPAEKGWLEDNSKLTDTQRQKIALADKLREYGIEDEEDLAEFREYRRQKAAAKEAAKQAYGGDEAPADEGSPPSSPKMRASRKTATEVIKDIVRRARINLL